MMTLFSLGKERNSQSVKGQQGRHIEFAPRATGSLLLTGIAKWSSGPIPITKLNSTNTTNTLPQNSPPVLAMHMSHSMRQLHRNLCSSMGTSPLLIPMNSLTLPIAISTLMDQHSRVTNHLKADPKEEGIRKEDQLPLAVSTI